MEQANELIKLDFKHEVLSRVKGASNQLQPSGLYCFELRRLIQEGILEKYLIKETVVGISSFCFNSAYNDRIAFLCSFSEV